MPPMPARCPVCELVARGTDGARSLRDGARLSMAGASRAVTLALLNKRPQEAEGQSDERSCPVAGSRGAVAFSRGQHGAAAIIQTLGRLYARRFIEFSPSPSRRVLHS